MQVALGAAGLLQEIGISAEVIDPRTAWPLDENTLVKSAKKTSRAMVVDEGYGRYGVTGEIASVIAEGTFYHLEAPVKRMGAMHVLIPFSPPLEDVTVPIRFTGEDDRRCSTIANAISPSRPAPVASSTTHRSGSFC